MVVTIDPDAQALAEIAEQNAAVSRDVASALFTALFWLRSWAPSRDSGRLAHSVQLVVERDAVWGHLTASERSVISATFGQLVPRCRCGVELRGAYEQGRGVCTDCALEFEMDVEGEHNEEDEDDVDR
jgi:hypothetical protein